MLVVQEIARAWGERNGFELAYLHIDPWGAGHYHCLGGWHHKSLGGLTWDWWASNETVANRQAFAEWLGARLDEALEKIAPCRAGGCI